MHPFGHLRYEPQLSQDSAETARLPVHDGILPGFCRARPDAGNARQPLCGHLLPQPCRGRCFARVAPRRRQARTIGTAGLGENRRPADRISDRWQLDDRRAGRNGRGQKSLHLGKLALFLLLSVGDGYLTWQLVQAGGGQVYEANPLADVWLRSFGWVGLLAFKGLTMLLVSLAALYVARHRPRTGGRLLLFACAVTALVVAYSWSLALQADSFQPAEAVELRWAEQQNRWLNGEWERERRYQAVLAQLGADLVAQRLGLGEAVDRLAQMDRSHDPRWLGHLHRAYPGRSDGECLAIHLVHHTLSDLPHEPAARCRLARQLEAEYRATYGTEAAFNATAKTNYYRPPSAIRPTGPLGVARSKGPV